MTKIGETVESLMEKYGSEAFLNHKDEVYGAMKAVCLCGEFLQDQSDWSGYPRPCTTNWEKRFSAEDLEERRELQEEELWKLKDKLDREELWTDSEIPLGGRQTRSVFRMPSDDLAGDGSRRVPLPLREFLMEGIRGLIQAAGSDTFSWTEYMETRIRANGYTGYKAVLEAVYTRGLFEILKFQRGISYHGFIGDFRDVEYILFVFGKLAPKEAREDYTVFSRKLLAELEDKRIHAMRQILEERGERMKEAERVRGGIPVLELFEKEMEKMDDTAFERFVRGQFGEGNYLYDWPGGTVWAQDQPLLHYARPASFAWESDRTCQRARLIEKVGRLAELFLYADRSLKERLFSCLPREEQVVVMERWMGEFNPYRVEVLAGRLRDILHAVDPGWPWYNKEEDKNEFPDIWWASLERILGRTVTEDELGDVIWDTEQWKSFYDDDWL